MQYVWQWSGVALAVAAGKRHSGVANIIGRKPTWGVLS